MHSMSSMPRHSSHSLTSFQFFTPRRFFTKAGVRARPPRLDGRTSFFAGGIIHQIGLRISEYSRAPLCKGREVLPAFLVPVENHVGRLRFVWLATRKASMRNNSELTTIGFDA